MTIQYWKVTLLLPNQNHVFAHQNDEPSKICVCTHVQNIRPPLNRGYSYIVALACHLIMASLSKRIDEHELLLW